ncbi:hypothetical protein [Paenibacillus elgii]|uniref:hypothetical protein n=1 Tax=Paenibacillus elgii TaxID=189691 RepID=UPI000FDB2F12|nr:hypothetical protein [Paenibacillus elgii]NEN85238.1 hypothetical protein [Paenibacillus elgii]
MYFKRWRKFLEHGRSESRRSDEISNRYDEILSKLSELEKELSLLKQDKQPGRDAPIIIENIHIENFKVDKIDHENNFGALGIKELSGQLNIGANYQTGGLLHSRDKQRQAAKSGPSSPCNKEGPQYTIRGKDI